LLLLLHLLDLGPYKVTGFTLQLDRLSLLRVVHLDQVLHFPYVAQGISQLLRWTRLLLLFLLLTLLLLLTLFFLSHRDLPGIQFVLGFVPRNCVK